MIINKQANGIPTKISLHQFASAMSQLDLTNVPEHSRQAAVMDHLTKVMIVSTTDPGVSSDLTSALLRKQHLRASGKVAQGKRTKSK